MKIFNREARREAQKQHKDDVAWLQDMLGRYKKKVEDQRKQILTLTRERDECYGGLNEMKIAMDTVLAEVAVKYGVKAEGIDKWLLVVPLPSVKRNTRDYTVHADVGKDNESYVVTVTRKQREEGDDEA